MGYIGDELRGNRQMVLRLAVVLGVFVTLSACADRPLHKFQSTDEGPEEFAILPAKPLSEPANFVDLPTPTPGGSNLTDPTPAADAIVALGGRPQAASAVPASDAALVNQAGRFGTQPGIRTELATADELIRKRAKRGPRLKIVTSDKYNQTYANQNIDAVEEQDRWLAAGASTPTAPPPGF